MEVLAARPGALPVLLVEEDVARILSISPRTLQRWRHEGFLPSRRIGKKVYYLEADILAALEPHKDGLT